MSEDTQTAPSEDCWCPNCAQYVRPRVKWGAGAYGLWLIGIMGGQFLGEWAMPLLGVADYGIGRLIGLVLGGLVAAANYKRFDEARCPICETTGIMAARPGSGG